MAEIGKNPSDNRQFYEKSGTYIAPLRIGVLPKGEQHDELV
jgi:hypothetical protein